LRPPALPICRLAMSPQDKVVASGCVVNTPPESHHVRRPALHARRSANLAQCSGHNRYRRPSTNGCPVGIAVDHESRRPLIKGGAASIQHISPRRCPNADFPSATVPPAAARKRHKGSLRRAICNVAATPCSAFARTWVRSFAMNAQFPTPYRSSP